MSELSLNEAELNDLCDLVKDFCLTNGLIFLKKNENTDKQSHDLAMPLPVTLFPTKFPKKEFDFALSLQQIFNQLIFSISQDHEFLKEALKTVILVDDFTNKLWEIYEQVRSEGISQPISLAILRNDFMLDQNKTQLGSDNTQLSQIEINTISCSFGSATSKVADLHRYILKRFANNFDDSKLARNDNMSILARSIVKAWELYENPKAKVVFLVSDSERNIGDQRLFEYECLKLNPNLIILRYTLSNFAQRGSLDENKKLFIDNNEIALVYYRAGYDPIHYLDDGDWQARLMIERSMAIKCPNIQLHLVGAKIVQQALSEPESVERFINNKEIAEKIRSTFVDIYSIKKDNLDKIFELIDNKSEEFVLKPQREGGGNNIYKEEIKCFVDCLEDKSDLMGYILMKLVNPYLNENYIIRSGQEAKKQSLISELGIYGYYISKANELIENETGGYLLRTKQHGVNEGGVASGYSALDSIYLY